MAEVHARAAARPPAGPARPPAAACRRRRRPAPSPSPAAAAADTGTTSAAAMPRSAASAREHPHADAGVARAEPTPAPPPRSAAAGRCARPAGIGSVARSSLRSRPRSRRRSHVAVERRRRARSQRKYSTLPAGPGSGLAVDALHAEPELGAPRGATLVHRLGAQLRIPHHAAAPSGSRPTSNCGLTIEQEVRVRRGARDQRREHQRQRDERQVRHDQVGRGAHLVRRGGRRTFIRSSTVTRSSVRSDQASCP